MKKRGIVFVLFVALLLACLAGCGSDKKGQEQSSNAAADITDSAVDAADNETEAADTQTALTEIDYLTLVNKLHPLPAGWEDILETVHFTNSVGDDVEVETKAYDAYLQLKEDLESEGIYVDLDSACRSIADQQRIMDEFTEKYGADYASKTVAVPGYSEHHTGLALDLYLIDEGEDITENEELVQYPETWSKIHAKLADYGFILRYLEGKEHVTGYSYEPWHIRYIDDPALAREIMDSGKTLEGYLGEANETDVDIDFGTSDLYTEEELEGAAIKIKCDFASWEGCELHSLRYAGDECNNKSNIEWLNSLGDNTDYTKIAEFLGDFHSPEDSRHWEPDHEYTDYQWWLAFSEEDGWDLIISNMEEKSSDSSDKKTEENTEAEDDASQQNDGYSVSPVEGSMYCHAEDGVNVRAGYSKDDAIIGVLQYGDLVRITGEVLKDGANYGWYQVDYGGQTAYVSAEFLSVHQPAGELNDSP